MRNIIIIGGGLSGLAAAHELETHNIPYTLIEVKPRLGGSIDSTHISGFIMDTCPMYHSIRDRAAFEAYLVELGLADAILPASDEHTNTIAFKAGAKALIDALVAKITQPVMYRMAVSTLGRFNAKRFSVCMENGMLLDANALIVASPARHAERMFHTLTPEISYRLLDYRYDTITRVSVGYKADRIDHLSIDVPEDYPITTLQRMANPARVPEGGGVILQAGVRVSPHDLPTDVVGEIAALMGWPLNPDADTIATWAESDPVMWRDEKHGANMTDIGHLLPQRVALIGSDYIPTDEAPRLDERIQQGIDAARAIISAL